MARPVSDITRVFAVVVGGMTAAMTIGCSKPAPLPKLPVPAEGNIKHASDHVDVVSKVYHVNRIYKSMTGPASLVRVKLTESPKPEIVWITGARVEMMDADGIKRMPDEFMCHANIDVDSTTLAEQLGYAKITDGRLFTLSQGQLAVKFPPGTGIPVRSDLPLELTTQVLNLNQKDANFDIRHHVTIDIVRDCDAKKPMIPLYEAGVSGQVSLEGHEFTLDMQDHGNGPLMGMCIPGQKAIDWGETSDRYGRKVTSHWVIKPGREVNHTRVTSIMNLKFDTKIHAIAVHMHPYAESLELRDATENKTIFKSKARNFPDKIGLEHMDTFVSTEGVPVSCNHEYELVSHYNNTSDTNADSMAVMYVYLFDPEYDHAKATQRLSLEIEPESAIGTLVPKSRMSM